MWSSCIIRVTLKINQVLIECYLALSVKITSEGGFVKKVGLGMSEMFIGRDCLKLSVPLPRPDVSKSAWNDNYSESSKGDNRPHVVLKS